MRWFLRNLRVKHWWNYMKPVPFAYSGGSWCTCPFISRKLRALSKETYCFFSTALIFFPSFFFFPIPIQKLRGFGTMVLWFHGSWDINTAGKRRMCASRISSQKYWCEFAPVLVHGSKNGANEIKSFNILFNHYRTVRTL